MDPNEPHDATCSPRTGVGRRVRPRRGARARAVAWLSVSAALVVVAAAPGCTQILGLDADARLGTPARGTTSSSATTSTSTGGCGDCTMGNDCLESTCAEGACTPQPKVAREPCSAGVCDGSGACVDCVVSEDCDAQHYCDTSNHRCVMMKVNGQACSSSAECAMGHCVGDPGAQICCSDACDGNCESCRETETGAPDGTCSPIKPGADPKGGCTGVTCSNHTCDGAGHCALALTGTPCSAVACAGSLIDPADTCDASGQCMPTQPTLCPGDFACDPMQNACETSCALQSDCAQGYYCQAPVCEPQKANGTTCQNAFECLSGNCHSGKCKP
jgi:hypothetical protein